jgi:hypothetical protein
MQACAAKPVFAVQNVNTVAAETLLYALTVEKLRLDNAGA